jgi:ribosomal protein L11 methyltransferase
MDSAPAPGDWLEVSAAVERDLADHAEEALFGAGAASVTLRDAADVPVLEPAPGETPLWPRVTIVGLFIGDTDPLAVLAAVQGIVPGAEWSIALLRDRLWEREWLRDFKPLRFGQRLAVVPTEMAAPPGSLVVRLDPGLAFGTGTHPTTALCLEWLDALSLSQGESRPPLQDALVIDYGCGSGILAIAALRLGAAEAIALDLDPQALLATRANAVINGVEARLVMGPPEALPDLLGQRKADVLVANILAGPLQALMPDFAAALGEGGALALSGILVGQEAALAAAAEPWFQLEPPAIREEWVRLSGQRNSAS